MMKLPIFQVDAFTQTIFSGNPAAVVPLEYWLDDEQMQRIASENNLSETAFFVNRGDYFHLRWFTPQQEVDLCGHATLASAYIIMEKIDNSISQVKFGTRGGELIVRRQEDKFSMDFPAHPPEKCSTPETLIEALGREPEELYASNYYMAVYGSEEDIRSLTPYMAMLKELDRLGVIVTARGKKVDFVSRFFAPAVGIPEDPVTGSAHCTLIPYWGKRLNKKKMIAHQISQRHGEIFCEHHGKRVIIAGRVVMYMKGTIYI